MSFRLSVAKPFIPETKVKEIDFKGAVWLSLLKTCRVNGMFSFGKVQTARHNAPNSRWNLDHAYHYRTKFDGMTRPDITEYGKMETVIVTYRPQQDPG